jgi:type IV pilus assembly protein PilW
MKNKPFGNNRGFTLIELMVGLVIGLVTLLAVTQVYLNWDSRQRTSSSKNNAQISGTLAAYTLERDIRQAGMGFGSASSPTDIKAGCAVAASFNGAPVNFNFIPLQIVNGDGGGTDQISVLYGNSSLHSLGGSVINSTATTKSLLNRAGFMPGDKVVLTSTTVPNTCQMVEVTVTDPITSGTTQAFQHLMDPYQSVYRPAGMLTKPSMNLAIGTATDTFDEAFNLGPEPIATVWSIAGATPVRPVLQKTNLLPVAGTIPPVLEISEGIVNLQAQYGYDVNDDGQIGATEWFDADNPLIAPTNWSRVLAVRYSLLARSRHYESLPFRAANPFWAGGQFLMADVSGSTDSDPAGANNWRAYRYVVYEGVVPLRNVLWGRL